MASLETKCTLSYAVPVPFLDFFYSEGEYPKKAIQECS